MTSTRRAFLHTAAATAAAPQTTSPNNKIQLGVIGCGARSQEVMRDLMATGSAQIVACSDAYQGRMERTQERVGQHVRRAADYKEILAARDIDAVCVVTPDHWHRQMILDALAAGKDVYCEKPMTYRSGEGGEIIRAAASSGRMLQIGSQVVSSAAQIEARGMVQAGKIGKVTMVRASYNRNSASGAWIYPIPPDASPKTVNWDMFLGPAPKRPFSLERFFRWRCYSDYSGGIATDLFVHLCTGIHYVLGAKAPARVVALGQLVRWKESRDVPDTLNALLEYPEGFAVNLSCSFNNQTTAESTFQFMGTEGTLELAGGLNLYPERSWEDNRWIVESWPTRLEKEYWKDPKNLQHPPKRVAVKPIPTKGENSGVAHVRAWLESIRTRKPHWEDAAVGHRAAACAHMINLAAKEHRAVEWDFAKDDIKA
ncbi:MAG: Gfo/Idh/MocA family oxidoreductase [Acidobacteria bacterium]|nr:Gfo/Idh/MocA family oxidoreductase [Acidobacteriota bacterium]